MTDGSRSYLYTYFGFEGDSQVYFFEGSYSDYEENKKKRLGGDIIPKRIQYKKHTRLIFYYSVSLEEVLTLTYLKIR